jgi:hypothetical protein
MSLEDFLTETFYLKEPSTTSFDGLGVSVDNNPDNWTTVYTFTQGRARQLSSREQYKAQGQEGITTHRILLNETHAKLKSPLFLVGSNGRKFRIIAVNVAKTLDTEHHYQVDCLLVEGV